MTYFTSPAYKSLPSPELPTPNAEEVAQFQRLFLANFGVELSEEEAHDQARRLVQFVFLMQHALPYLTKDQVDFNKVQTNFNKAQVEHKKSNNEKTTQKSIKPSY